MGFFSVLPDPHSYYFMAARSCIFVRQVLKWGRSCSLSITFTNLLMIFINLFTTGFFHSSQIRMPSIEVSVTEFLNRIQSTNIRYYFGMRILVQRVFESWVKVGGIEISRIKEGLLVLVGITHDDNPDVADHMVSKILNMRLWEKEGKNWNGSVMEINGEIMVVSQFTLYGILKGNKPDFHASMEADKAKQLFNYVVDELKNKYNKDRVQTGKFQALMEVGSVINGPVTIQYEKAAEQMPRKKTKPVITKGKKQEESIETKSQQPEVIKQPAQQPKSISEKAECSNSENTKQ